MNGESHTTPTEEQIRKIAREEARKVNDIEVEDADGEGWSIPKLMDQFEISRRTALQAIGLMSIGYHAPKAVLRVVSQNAEAASDDNLTVPGTLDAGAVDTDRANIGGGDQINQIEFGTVDMTYPAAASDATMDTNENVSTTITFSSEFSSIPSISLDCRDREGVVAGYYVSTTDVTIILRNYSTNDHSSFTDPVSWTAIN